MLTCAKLLVSNMRITSIVEISKSSLKEKVSSLNFCETFSRKTLVDLENSGKIKEASFLK